MGNSDSQLRGSIDRFGKAGWYKILYWVHSGTVTRVVRYQDYLVSILYLGLYWIILKFLTSLFSEYKIKVILDFGLTYKW